jgi:hypothetical protein
MPTPARSFRLAADIRAEVARTLDQLRWLAANGDRHGVIPLVRNRLACQIADHALAAKGAL